jgi:DNA-binding winged helix-turn-helix (wHTH) protein/tetratricopeptide (TPR) repeat protein
MTVLVGRFRVGDFEADPQLNELRGPSGAVRIEPKVMEVLAYLAARSGQTVSREELLEQIWEKRFVVEEVLTRSISQLRSVFGDDPREPRYVQTVQKRGYRLIAPVAFVEVPVPQPDASRAPVTTEGPDSRHEARPGRRVWLAVAFGLVLTAAAFLAVRFGWLGRHAEPADAGSIATRNREAVRLFHRALGPLQQGSCAPEVLGLLGQAVELDPSWPTAWEQYGWALYNRVSSCGESGAHYTKALAAGDRALGLDPQRWGAIGLRSAILVETGRAEDAYGLLRGALARNPDDARLRFFASYALTYAGFLDQAVGSLERSVAADESFLTAQGWTPNALLHRGDLDRFAALLPQGGSPLLRFYRGFVLHRLGRDQEALAALGPAFRDRPGDVFARLAEALAALLRQDRESAGILLGQLSLQRRKVGAVDGELTFKLAELLAAVGEREKALAEARLAVEQGFFCPSCFSDDPLLAPLRGEAGFEVAMDAARRRHRSFAERFGLTLEQGTSRPDRGQAAARHPSAIAAPPPATWAAAPPAPR